MKHEKIQQAFTLIELLIAISVIGILSSLGIAAFVTYDHVQSISTARLDLATMLITAKSRALSQVKPTACSGSLDGYEVRLCNVPGQTNSCINTASADYELDVSCGNTFLIDQKKLGTNVGWGNTSPASPTKFFFPIATGGIVVTGDSNTITIIGYGYKKTIMLYPADGRIVIN